jgi:ankyrin repeat protein
MKHPKDRPAVDRAGRTELHYAARDGDPAAVQRLLAEGLNPCAVDDKGWTPLHFAAQSQAAETARVLLAAGAHVDATDSDGRTPLFRAVWSSRGQGETIKLLREQGADPKAAAEDGASPLKLARIIANFDVRQYFSDLPDDTAIEGNPKPARPEE